MPAVVTGDRALHNGARCRRAAQFHRRVLLGPPGAIRFDEDAPPRPKLPFQMAPQRFPRNVGVVTGLVGATGGAGGFYLAASLGAAKQFTGGYGAGLAIFACLALAALTALTGVGARWRRTWLDRSALAAANA